MSWCFRSLDQRSFETLGIVSVRPCVTLFLGNRFLKFYMKSDLKSSLSAFLTIFTVLAILAKNCPNLAFFSRIAHQIFLIFCLKHNLWSWKKWRFCFFWEISKMAHFGKKKRTQIWPRFGQNDQKWRFSRFYWKPRIKFS